MTQTKLSRIFDYIYILTVYSYRFAKMGPKKSVPKPADMPTLEFTFDSKEVEKVDELKKPDTTVDDKEESKQAPAPSEPRSP